MNGDDNNDADDDSDRNNENHNDDNFNMTIRKKGKCGRGGVDYKP